MSNITLNASMRSNLLSLKNIATQMDKTQLILATGKKVNSAIDNASSYYQARSLTAELGNQYSIIYLSLETRQQLAINSLSLASISARSILSLFY